MLTHCLENLWEPQEGSVKAGMSLWRKARPQVPKGLRTEWLALTERDIKHQNTAGFPSASKRCEKSTQKMDAHDPPTPCYCAKY